MEANGKNGNGSVRGIGYLTEKAVRDSSHDREEVIVAQAILSVTRALNDVPEAQVANVFNAVQAICATARGKVINVESDMEEIAKIREELTQLRRIKEPKKNGIFGGIR